MIVGATEEAFRHGHQGHGGAHLQITDDNSCGLSTGCDQVAGNGTSNELALCTAQLTDTLVLHTPKQIAAHAMY